MEPLDSATQINTDQPIKKQKVNTERNKRQQEQQVQAGINSLLSEDIGEQ